MPRPPDRRPKSSTAEKGKDDQREPLGVRIIGGKHRGRTLVYSGDMRTRPMKDRVREALFNLVGPMIKGAHAVDLFAGTGVLGLESVSRGAASVTLIERHLPTAQIIKRNAGTLEISAQTNVVFGDAFCWMKKPTLTAPEPWVVFCSPPYSFYIARQAEMLDMIARAMTLAPIGSVLVVESDERFNLALLPNADRWNTRIYMPAVVSILTTTGEPPTFAPIPEEPASEATLPEASVPPQE